MSAKENSVFNSEIETYSTENTNFIIGYKSEFVWFKYFLKFRLSFVEIIAAEHYCVTERARRSGCTRCARYATAHQFLSCTNGSERPRWQGFFDSSRFSYDERTTSYFFAPRSPDRREREVDTTAIDAVARGSNSIAPVETQEGTEIEVICRSSRWLYHTWVALKCSKLIYLKRFFYARLLIPLFYSFHNEEISFWNFYFTCKFWVVRFKTALRIDLIYLSIKCAE